MSKNTRKNARTNTAEITREEVDALAQRVDALAPVIQALAVYLEGNEAAKPAKTNKPRVLTAKKSDGSTIHRVMVNGRERIITRKDGRIVSNVAASDGITVKKSNKPSKARSSKGASKKGKSAIKSAKSQPMTRKAWNHALTTKARFAGKRNGESVYSLVIAGWAEVQEARQNGMTPDEALSLFM